MADGLRDVAGAARPGRARWCAARRSPTASSCARCGCRSAWSGSSTRPAPTSPPTPPASASSRGNAVLLRGSSSARRSNEAVVAVLRDAAAGGRAAGRRRPAGAGGGPRVGQGADAGPRAGRRADPARRRRPDPVGRRGVHGAGDRDRRRQLPRLRRPRRRPGHGAGDRAQRQDPPAVGLQRRRVAAGARRRRGRVRAAGGRAPCRTPASPCTATTTFARPATGWCRRPRRTTPPSTSPSTSPRPSYPTSTRRSRHIRTLLLGAHRGDRHRLPGRGPPVHRRRSTRPR